MTPAPPSVLFVGAFPPPGREVFGGMVSSCEALRHSSFSQRCRLDLLDSTQITNPPPSLWRRLWLAVPRVSRFVWRLERHRPDVVLLFAAVGASLLEKGCMAWYARLRGVPALMFPRGGAVIDQAERSPLAARVIRVSFGGARLVLCQSERWHTFARTTLGFAEADAPIIANWTALPSLIAIGRARQVSTGEAPVRLLFLGWVDREKGIAELLDACASLASTRRFELTIAGDGTYASAARADVARRGLDAVVSFPGWLQGDALQQALAAADVLVLPSWAEGLPNAVVEGMAAGLAIVATSVGSIPDVITDGRTGLLVPPRDPNALSGALARVIDDPALRAELGRAAWTVAGERFAVEPAVDRLCAAIQYVLSPDRADRRD